jgi:Icc-related predicted phosphoesterase
MKILVIGDLHGQMPKIYFKEFDIIIVPGDICLDTDIRKYVSLAYKEFLVNPLNYSDWWDIVGKNKAKKYINKSLKRGREILKKLDSFNVPIYIIPGNWDLASKEKEWEYLNKNWYKEYLIKGLKNIKDINYKIITTKEITLIGYGLVNGPELLKYRNYKNVSKDRYKKNVERYNTLSTKYTKLFFKAKKSKRPIIFLSHNVPFNTPLDKINNKDSPMNGRHYGSNLTRDMIVKHKPILCIGGHMHEHYGTCKLGRTIILNAGFGGDKNTLIELENGKIKSIKFHGKKK